MYSCKYLYVDWSIITCRTMGPASVELRLCHGIYHVILTYSLLLCTYCLLHVKADDIVKKKTIHIEDEKDEAGIMTEELQDIFELTEENFKDRVLDSSDPWIVVFHDGVVDRQWRSLAVDMRGMTWFGAVHRLKQEDLVEELKYPLRKSPPARVYPWGSLHKKKKWIDVINPEEAKMLSIDSIPDPTTKFVPDNLHTFLFDSYSTVPSRLPVIFFVESDELTPLFKSVGLHYNKYFHFGSIKNPTKDDLTFFKYSFGLPGMIVLIAEDFAEKPERETPDYNFQVISYSTEKQGRLNYANLLRLLYGVNYQFRHTLPGMNLAEEDEILQMEEELDMENERFNLKYVDRIKEAATYKTYRTKAKSGIKTVAKKTSSSSKEKGKKKGKQNGGKVVKEEVPGEKYDSEQFGRKSEERMDDKHNKEEL